MSGSPSAAATAVLYNGRSAEMLVAYADEATGELHTLQFEETRADHGEVELLGRLDWNRKAPTGASIVIPEAGHPLTKLDEYWLMWGCGTLLFAQSVHRPTALSSALAHGELIIDRPVVAANRELHVYGWRDGKLIRHRYGAGREGETRVVVDLVQEIESQPSRSICIPLPGDEAGAAMIGFVHETDGAVTASVLYERAGKVIELSGKAEGRYRLMGRHRMGMHAGRKSRPALAMLTENCDDDSYALLEARFDFGKSECVWKRTKLEMVAPGNLESAVVLYFKTQDSPDPFILAVDKAGRLISPRRRTVAVIRNDVGAGYGYPILTTMTNRYEAVGMGEEIRLQQV